MSPLAKGTRVRTRERILLAAIRLFQERGYHGVGLSEILAAADAPKGCLYHHFPDGKADLAIAALESIAADYETAFASWRARGTSVAAIVRKLGDTQARWLAQNDWRQAGLFSVLVQGFVPEAPGLHAVLARVHERRYQLVAHALQEDGLEDACGLATLALAALDGGMIQAAATRDAGVLRISADRVARCLEARSNQSSEGTWNARATTR